MPEDRLEQLEQEVQQLRASLESLAAINPQVRRTIEQIVGNESPELVTDYDRVVDEGGAANYQVPKQFDGLVLVDNKLFGYYNPN